MMFLILFGSLAAAMAIASRGNIRTASTHVHVMRAQGAAETGLAVAKARLQEAASRFLVSDSTVDQTFGNRIWTGNVGGLGSVSVLPPPSGFSESTPAWGIAQALANHHASDQNVVTQAGIGQPTLANAMAGASDEYATNYWVYTPAIALEAQDDSGPLCFSVIYAPLANGTDVRAIVTGYDFSYARNGEPLKRTIMQDFRLVKKVNHAIIGSNRIMVGKNVNVEGDLGMRYTQTQFTNGDPLVLRSDFLGLDSVLDQKINALFANLKQYDVDLDGRLRAKHPIESQGIPSNLTDYDNDGTPDGAFMDATRDGFVDDFDIFIRHYDRNADNKVTLSPALAAGTPAEGTTPEFVKTGGAEVDADLAMLIDGGRPDRNKNGVYGFSDINSNGWRDAGEPFLDIDTASGANRDQVLGYRDGVIDAKDNYAKVGGKLRFRVTKSQWEQGQGPTWHDALRGPVRPGRGSATTFGLNDTQLPDISASVVSSTTSVLQSAANGASFDDQVAQQLGVSVADLATYVENAASGSSEPKFYRLHADANLDGRPDNWQTAYFETMPFASPSYSDWYYRPVYENMTFKDVQIPMGTNALFKNCTFAGVTWVRAYSANGHVLWAEYGKMQLNAADQRPEPNPPRSVYGDSAGETSYPTMLPPTALPPNQMVMMANPPMDKADLTAAQALVTQNFNLLPDPLVIDGRRVTDTRLYSNNIRFHDCLFVGSIVSDQPVVYQQSRNKIQFTGATRFTRAHPTQPDDPSLNSDSSDLPEIAKSSLMLPQYSVDIGTFNSPPTQNVALTGAIVAGVLDVRGNTSIDGALLLTFDPVVGQAPLIDALGNPVGNPAGYNTTLGYFGPNDGDSESLDPNTLPTVNGQKIVGWDLNGDGIADLGPNQQPTQAQLDAGAVVVPFHGFGRINIRFDPDMTLPDGIMLPLQFDSIANSYREGKP